MLIDAYEPGANFVSSRSLRVNAPAARVWAVLPQLPVALRRSLVAPIAALPLALASLLRGDLRPGDLRFGAHAWRLDAGAVLAPRLLRVGPVRAGKEVVLLGQHRYATYATSFAVDAAGRGRSRVRNITRASFAAGTLGAVYITGVRVFRDPYTDWMLRCIKRLAETPAG
jgi:hypothetical protein